MSSGALHLRTAIAPVLWGHPPALVSQESLWLVSREAQNPPPAQKLSAPCWITWGLWRASVFPGQLPSLSRFFITPVHPRGQEADRKASQQLYKVRQDNGCVLQPDSKAIQVQPQPPKLLKITPPTEAAWPQQPGCFFSGWGLPAPAALCS